MGLVPNAVVCQYADGEETRFPKDGEPMNGNILEEFGKWLFQEKHRHFTIIAHNFRAFDGHFILKYMLDNDLRPEVIKRGTQLLDLRYPKLNICARDTLNFCALKLSQFPKAVGLQGVTSKGAFPHFANKPENWDKIIPFPTPTEYGADRMSEKERKDFFVWWTDECLSMRGRFDFRKEIKDYCSDDVTVLRLCALKFREDFIGLCQVDPFKSVTIAAACQK